MGETWSMFGRLDGDTWTVVGDKRYLHYHGCDDPTPIVVQEDPDGEYLGWIDTGETELTMIQRKQIFNIQFPYGYRPEEERGNGRAVPLSIQPAERSS